MHLHEAVQSRTVEKPFIARRSWRDELAPCFFTDVKLLPTDSPKSYKQKRPLPWVAAHSRGLNGG